MSDPLRHVSSASVGPWLPLESNPALLNEVGLRWGLPAGYSFEEILGFSPDLLSMVQQPVQAAVFLFPCTDAMYKYRASEHSRLPTPCPSYTTASSPPSPILFLHQHSEFGNACGTIAAVHAISNACSSSLPSSSPVGSFATTQRGKASADVGRALLANASLKSASDSVASSDVAQTSCPGRDAAPLDHHFVAFVKGLTPVGDMRVLELDGTKKQPVDHGACTPSDFLSRVGEVVQRIMALDPDQIEYALIALTGSS